MFLLFYCLLVWALFLKAYYFNPQAFSKCSRKNMVIAFLTFPIYCPFIIVKELMKIGTN